MDQLSITNQIHCCTHSELAVEAIQLSDTRHVLVSVHVTGGVVTSAALHACMHIGTHAISVSASPYIPCTEFVTSTIYCYHTVYCSI